MQIHEMGNGSGLKRGCSGRVWTGFEVFWLEMSSGTLGVRAAVSFDAARLGRILDFLAQSASGDRIALFLPC